CWWSPDRSPPSTLASRQLHLGGREQPGVLARRRRREPHVADLPAVVAQRPGERWMADDVSGQPEGARVDPRRHLHLRALGLDAAEAEEGERGARREGKGRGVHRASSGRGGGVPTTGGPLRQRVKSTSRSTWTGTDAPPEDKDPSRARRAWPSRSARAAARAS